MADLNQYMALLTNSEEIIRVGGLALVVTIVFLETGVFFCFFLPGDYLLFSAGVFVGTGTVDVGVGTLLGSIFAAAVAGNYSGYFFGKYLGHRLMEARDSFFFKKKYLEQTREVFDKYGGRALIVGRFLPIVRTFAPVMAGIANMNMKAYSFYNLAGAAAWVLLLTGSGYLLGEQFKDTILGYLHYIILAFMAFTTGTVVISYFRVRRQAEAEAKTPKA